jgi:hypothetical protein
MCNKVRAREITKRDHSTLLMEFFHSAGRLDIAKAKDALKIRHHRTEGSLIA